MESNGAGDSSSLLNETEIGLRERLVKAVIAASGDPRERHSEAAIATLAGVSGRRTPPPPTRSYEPRGRQPESGVLAAATMGRTSPMPLSDAARRRQAGNGTFIPTAPIAYLFPPTQESGVRRQDPEAAVLAATGLPTRRMQQQAVALVKTKRTGSPRPPSSGNHKDRQEFEAIMRASMNKDTQAPTTILNTGIRGQRFPAPVFPATQNTPKNNKEAFLLKQYESSIRAVQAGKVTPFNKPMAAGIDAPFGLEALASAASTAVLKAPARKGSRVTCDENDKMNPNLTKQGLVRASSPKPYDRSPRSSKNSRSLSPKPHRHSGEKQFKIPNLHPKSPLSPKNVKSPMQSRSPVRSTSPGPMKKRRVPAAEEEIFTKRPRLEAPFRPVSDDSIATEPKRGSTSPPFPVEQDKRKRTSPVVSLNLRSLDVNSPQQPKTSDLASLPEDGEQIEKQMKSHYQCRRGVPSPIFGFSSRYPAQLYDSTFPTSLTYRRNPFLTSRRSAWDETVKFIPTLLEDNVQSDTLPENISHASSSVTPNESNGTIFDDPETAEQVKVPEKVEIIELVRADVQADVVKSESKNIPKKGKSKKKKIEYVHERVPLSQQDFTSPKDRLFAKKALTGQTDLGLILEEVDTEWLGKNLWIFTVQQLRHVLREEGGELTRRRIAMSSLVQGNENLEEPGYVVESHPLADSEFEGIQRPTSSANTRNTKASLKQPKDESGVISLQDREGKENLNDSKSTEGSERIKESGSDLEKIMSSSITDQETDPMETDGDETSQVGKEENEPTIEQLKEADQKLQEWSNLVQSTDLRTLNKTKTQFSLDGALRFLLPVPVRHFIKTIKVTNLRDFLSLKKTEAAPLTSVYKDWRRHCELPTMKGYCLARHFLGLTQRIEKAVTSIPPVDEYTRIWMGQVFCILTGGSKDFIIGECKVNSVDVFLTERTKEWSDKLVAWREVNNLPPLKGSGKVAMVSGWKTSLKEAIDVERGFGRIISEEELLKVPPLDPNVEVVEPVQKKRVMKKATKPSKEKPPPQSYESGESALQSPSFLASCLRGENVRFLGSVGISTAQDLIEADKRIDSPVVRELIRFRTEVTSVPSQAATCVRLMYDWTQRVKNKLEEIQSDSVKSLAKKRGPRPKEDSEATEDPKSTKGTKDSKSTTSRQQSVAAVMETLSNTTRTFLDTMKINDAEGLLKTKTSLISKKYVEWRGDQGMQPLKGYGSIATVSGWKAQIRKSAVDAGLHEINAIVPEDHNQLIGPSGFDCNNNVNHSQIDTKIVITYTHDPRFLFGLPLRRFKVQSTTVRQKVDRLAKESCIFLTFLGRRKIVPSFVSDGLELLDSEKSRDVLPVLLDVSNATESANLYEEISTFSTLHDGCGLIDVGSYGVKEILVDNHLEPLKILIRLFMLEQDTKVVEMMEEKCKSPRAVNSNVGGQNVFQSIDTLGTRHYLFNQIEPMEEGQAVPICFAKKPLYETPRLDKSRHRPGVLARFIIGKILSTLSTVDIRELLDWIGDILIKDITEINGASGIVTDQESPKGKSLNASESDQAINGECPEASLGTKIAVTEDSDIALSSKTEQSKSETAQNISLKNLSAVCQRRLHWLGANILKYTDRIDKVWNLRTENKACEEKNAFRTKAEMLTRNNSFEEIRRSKNPTDHPLYKQLSEEVCDEIEASLAMNMDNSIFDRSLFCKIAQELYTKCQKIVCDHVLLNCPSSLQKQERLLHDLCELTVQYASSINGDTKTDRMDLARSDDGQLVATGREWQNAIFRQRVEVQSGDAKINWQWYVHCQILRVVHEVASCDQLAWLMTPDPVYSHTALVAAIENDIDSRYPVDSNKKEDVIVLGNYSPAKSSNKFSAAGAKLSASTAPVALIPNSLPLFLGLVWPKLKGLYGWKLDAGTSVHDVTFLPPGQKNRAKRKKDKSAQIKLERLQKRARMEKRLQEVGFGYIPKLTKRLVLQSTNGPPEHDGRASAKRVLAAFAEELKSELENNKSKGVDSITKGFFECFDSIVQYLDEGIPSVEDCFQSKMEGREQLLPILMMLPSILQQSGLPYRQMENALGCVKDLVRYMTLNCDTLFDKSFVPLKEEYAAQEEMPPKFVSMLLKNMKPTDLSKTNPKGTEGGSKDLISNSLIMPEDLIDLTAFLEMTMGQVLYCRATKADNSKKGRRSIPIGYPGMVCKHCLGLGGEGKYFFSSVESLGTAPGVVFSHLLKCIKFPTAERQKLVAKKGKHAEQRKSLRHGAQAKYFSRVWKRLHSSAASGVASVYIVNNENDRSPPKSVHSEDIAVEGDLIEFKSHLDVLRYIEKTSPWKESPDLLECIKTYQFCLSKGARIYASHCMPAKFSSEWLLGKLAPNRITLKQQMRLS